MIYATYKKLMYNFFNLMIVATCLSVAKCGTEAGNPSTIIGIKNISLSTNANYFSNDSKAGSFNTNFNTLYRSVNSQFLTTSNQDFSRVPLLKINRAGEISPAIVFDNTPVDTFPFIVRTQRSDDKLFVLFDAPVKAQNQICTLLMLSNHQSPRCIDHPNLPAYHNLLSEQYPLAERTRPFLVAQNNDHVFYYTVKNNDSNLQIATKNNEQTSQLMNLQHSEAQQYYSINGQIFAQACKNTDIPGPQLNNWCRLNASGDFTVFGGSIEQDIYPLDDDQILITSNDYNNPQHLNIFSVQPQFDMQIPIADLSSSTSDTTILQASSNFSGGVFQVQNKIFSFASESDSNAFPILELTNLGAFNVFSGFVNPLEKNRIAYGSSGRLALSNSRNFPNQLEVHLINDLDNLTQSSSIDLSGIDLNSIETLHFLDAEHIIIGGPLFIFTPDGPNDFSVQYKYYLHNIDQSLPQNQLILKSDKKVFFDILPN